MIIKQSLVGFLILIASLHVNGQKTTVYTEAHEDFKRGTGFYDQGLYAQSINEFNKVLQKLRPVNEADADLLRIKAELKLANAAIRLELPDSEKMILDFIRKYSPDPISNQALRDVANYYFDSRQYDKAIEFYELVPTYQLTSSERAEVKFKLGYSHFVQKEFKEARTNFYQIRQVPGNDYYYPANYYYGLCGFFEGNYNEAVKSFEIAENYIRYQPYIPYYLAQIYFAQGKYDELIAYAENKLKISNLRNEEEVRQLIGQAYFEKGMYKEALPYLEYYAERSSKMREDEFYQLGIAQYRTGHYEKAIPNLEQLTRADSKLGQHAMLILGDCYLKSGNKAGARNAFAIASRMEYDAVIREDATFNFAKLSYETKFDSDALSALQVIQPGSNYYAEAQELMSELFLNSRDYAKAIDIIEKMPERTPQLRETYQKVTYLRGLQLYQVNDWQGAKSHFRKSLENPVDVKTKALSNFWLGRIAFDQNDFSTAISQLGQYLTLAKTLRELPDEASPYMANYILGYCYLKEQNFTTAQGYFQEAVAGIKRNRPFINNQKVEKSVLGDAVLRAGDCLFKRNKYSEAIKFYDEAIDGGYTGFDYAMFQKGTIDGLRGRRTEQILAYENLAKRYPESAYADDALFELGRVYTEINRLGEATQPLKKLVTDYRGKSSLVNRALIQLGLVSYNQGNLEVAINYYKQVFANNPTPDEANEALKALEEIYINNLGRPEEYTTFLETVPGYTVDESTKDSINFKAAETQYENGNYEKAISGFTSYINRFPNGQNRLTASFHRGNSYYELKKYSEALRDYEYVINRGPSRYYADAIEFAALISYNHEQDFSRAYNYFTLMEKNAPSAEKKFEAQLGAMRSAYRTNNSPAVYENAEKVATNPSATVDQQALANLYIGKISSDKKDFDKALQAFQKVNKQVNNENAAEARYRIAYIYYVQRDLDKALEICERANRESASYPYWVAKSVILMADIYTERNDLLSAKTILEAVIENYKGDEELLRIAKAKKEQIDAILEKNSRLERGSDDGTIKMDEGN